LNYWSCLTPTGCPYMLCNFLEMPHSYILTVQNMLVHFNTSTISLKNSTITLRNATLNIWDSVLDLTNSEVCVICTAVDCCPCLCACFDRDKLHCHARRAYFYKGDMLSLCNELFR
jgi:hypothetical protein